ncbi:YbaB/EbfC family nucleoid-associated protein [Mycobacterium deserti]|uniref:YbaB/EbfC family nucleoid-associated protein n=1 Tax=Mycobacterium deserti TaxID=2978347 RepID=A0ABT2MBQ2_9MYCO|nr:YbaB/EbfC family nucleoid-associated protein [Mycobacterium deserti]MCT7659698.1 YbaB/EbfC family nucleoid-associated protein [Mycobacterium deserti]
MDNETARHDLTEALALMQEHLAELAVVERRRAALSATAASAEGTVVVAVDARGVVFEANVDESYFDEHDLADLGGFIAEAAQAAAADVAHRSAEMLAPLSERRAQFPSLADIVDGAPDIRSLLRPNAAADHNGTDPDHYPTVRSSP